MMYYTTVWSDTNRCFAGARPTGKWEEGNVPEHPRHIENGRMGALGFTMLL